MTAERKSPAKINIFLKITGKRQSYHEIFSRFIRFEPLSDTVSLVEKKGDGFRLDGDFGCSPEQNTIYQGYVLLQEKVDIGDFFDHHVVKVEKKIPEGSGLGGGSSNAATFLLIVNELLECGLSRKELAEIGEKIGADVPFFIYGYPAANVSGIGEVIEPFEDTIPELELFTPDIACHTGRVYQKYAQDFYCEADASLMKKWADMSSEELLSSYPSQELNDLLPPALALYPELSPWVEEGWKMSGSGSSFFRVRS